MNEITLQLPKTLYQNLEVLAEKEAVPLTHYILYILTRQMSSDYTVHIVPEEEVAVQKTSFDNLLRRWGRVPSAEVDRILDKRASSEPEADLDPEIVSQLKAQIARSKNIR